MSVGWRLSGLVVSELIVASVLVLMALVTLARLSEEQTYIRRYVFEPLVDIGGALADVDQVERAVAEAASDQDVRVRAGLGRLEAFISRYENVWEVAGGTSPDAKRFIAQLESQGQLQRLDEERNSVQAFRAALDNLQRRGMPPGQSSRAIGDVWALSQALMRLNDVNLRYMEIANKTYAARTRSLVGAYLLVGLGGLVAAPLFGLSVRKAIVPRVRRLVNKVQRFRDLGVDEPIGETGGDELAVLARALDVSFTAIAARDKERNRFLAIAAHEFKTPLTSVLGFAQAALAHGDDPTLRERSLTIIGRQATRLNRLVEDLLWISRVQGGSITFCPAPLDLAEPVRRAISKVVLAAKGHEFPLVVQGDTHILGDAELLGQATLSLLFQACAMGASAEPVKVTVEANATRACVRVTTRCGEDVPQDLDMLLEPFSLVQFEGPRDRLRDSGLSLYVAREIVRLHGGGLGVERCPPDLVEFTLKLRR